VRPGHCGAAAQAAAEAAISTTLRSRSCARRSITEDKRGDVAVLEMTAGRPDGVNGVPLRRPQQSVDHRFAVQGFPDGTLIAATGWIRTRLTISQEWVQLEDDKVPGRAVTEGFSGAASGTPQQMPWSAWLSPKI